MAYNHNMSSKILLATSVAVLGYVLGDLLFSLCMAGLFASLLYPYHRHLVNVRKTRPVNSALVLTLGTALLFILPLAFVAYLAFRAILQKVPALTGIKEASGSFNIEESAVVSKGLEFLQNWFGIERSDVLSALQDMGQVVGTKVAEFLAGSLTTVPSVLLSLAIITISLFFFLLDAHKIRGFLVSLRLFPESMSNRLINFFPVISRSLLLASLLVGLAQATIFGITAFSLSLTHSLLIGFLVFLASFIPVVGSSPVTFGVVLYELFVMGATGKGITLLVAAVVCSISDNVIRTVVLKEGVNLHPLLALISVIGGVATMGVPGIFLGPIIAGYAALICQIHSEKPN